VHLNIVQIASPGLSAPLLLEFSQRGKNTTTGADGGRVGSFGVPHRAFCVAK